MPDRPSRIAVLVLVVLTLGVSACSSSHAPKPASTATPVAVESYIQRGPHGVGVTTIELIDATRPTAPNGEFPGAPERRMQVEVWYPAAAGAESPEARDAPVDGGPYPLIVFAHGLGGNRRQSAAYTQHLASHGYVVASPDFPSSHGGAPGGARLGGVIDQPRDVSFIIDRMLALNAESGNPFASAIDGARIGVTGHSLGGLTSLLTSYGPDRDARVRAILPISAPGCFLDADVIGDVTTPVMVLGGSEDLLVGATSLRLPYELAHAPRYFVELAGADHIKFADIDINDRDVGGSAILSSVVGGNTLVGDAIAIAEHIGGSVAPCVIRDGPKGREPLTGARQRELLRFFGALFFDAYLRGSEAAQSLLRSGTLGSIAPEATIEFE